MVDGWLLGRVVVVGQQVEEVQVLVQVLDCVAAQVVVISDFKVVVISDSPTLFRRVML